MKIVDIREIEGGKIEVETDGYITIAFMNVIVRHLDSKGYTVDKDAILDIGGVFTRWFTVSTVVDDMYDEKRVFTFKLKEKI